MQLLKKLSSILDQITEHSGRLVAWLVLAMTLLVCYDVFMRYVFRTGSVALQELEWHLFALLFLLGAAYTYKHDAHVRVELLYQKMSPRQRAWANLLGNLLFLIPFAVLVISSSLPFVHDAFVFNESSPDPGGLPYRFVLKAAIPLGFALLILQSVAEVIRQILMIAGQSAEEAGD